MTNAVLHLEPLSCPSCMIKIETALNSSEGVQFSKVLFNAAKVKVAFDQSVVDAKELAEKLEDIGFPVINMIES